MMAPRRRHVRVEKDLSDAVATEMSRKLTIVPPRPKSVITAAFLKNLRAAPPATPTAFDPKRR